MFAGRLPSRLTGPLAALALGALLTLGGPPGQAAQERGNVEITVIGRAFGGAAPAPGTTGGGSITTPLAGIEVRAAPVGGGPPLTTTTTDASGSASLTVPAGDYWLYVPTDRPGTASLAAISTFMPDRTLVHAWQAVTVAADATTAVRLSLTILQP